MMPLRKWFVASTLAKAVAVPLEGLHTKHGTRASPCLSAVVVVVPAAVMFVVMLTVKVVLEVALKVS